MQDRIWSSGDQELMRLAERHGISFNEARALFHYLGDDPESVASAARRLRAERPADGAL